MHLYPPAFSSAGSSLWSCVLSIASSGVNPRLFFSTPCCVVSRTSAADFDNETDIWEASIKTYAEVLRTCALPRQTTARTALPAIGAPSPALGSSPSAALRTSPLRGQNANPVRLVL